MKRKKVNRSLLFLTLCGVFVTIIAMSVVYAALSTTLNISGSASVNSSEWSLSVTEDDTSSWATSVFSNSGKIINGNSITFGDGTVVKKPTISGTTLSGFEFSLIKPGDDVALYYRITNTGTIPAIYKSYYFFEPTITSSVGNSNDVIWGRDNVSFGFDIAAPNGDGKMLPISTDYVLCPGEYVLVVMGSKIFDVNTIPTAAVTFSNIKGEIVFEQADLNSCPS